MSARSHVYVNFKADRITVDLRVFAPSDMPLDKLKTEVMFSYMELMDRIDEVWKRAGDKT